MSVIKEVIDFARRHGGVITTREALDLGLGYSTLARRIDDGVLVRLGRGVLALPGTATRPDASLRAAGRVLGAVVSHQSAALLHGMTPIEPSMPTVTVAYRSTHRFPGVLVHQSTDLHPEHLTKVGPHLVTTPTRTLIDLAKVTKPRRLGRVVDNALSSGSVEFDRLFELHLSLARRGKKGTVLMRRLLIERADSQVPESVLESRLLEVLSEAGLPRPTSQFAPPWLTSIRGRVDFAYENERIVIEADSRRWHGLFEAFEADRRRDIEAQLAGWMVLRFTWKMLDNDPTFVVGATRKALEDRRM